MVQETWLTDTPIFKGYTTYHIPATPPLSRGRAKGGTTMLMDDHIHSTKTPSPRGNPQADILQIRLKLADHKIDTNNIYNPPNTHFSLTPILRLHKTTATHQIIMGDFNIHHIAWGRNNTDTRRCGTLLAHSSQRQLHRPLHT